MERQRKSAREFTIKDCEKYTLKDLERLEASGRIKLPLEYQRRVEEFRELYGDTKIDEADEINAIMKRREYQRKYEVEREKRRNFADFDYNSKFNKPRLGEVEKSNE